MIGQRRRNLLLSGSQSNPVDPSQLASMQLWLRAMDTTLSQDDHLHVITASDDGDRVVCWINPQDAFPTSGLYRYAENIASGVPKAAVSGSMRTVQEGDTFLLTLSSEFVLSGDFLMEFVCDFGAADVTYILGNSSPGSHSAVLVLADSTVQIINDSGTPATSTLMIVEAGISLVRIRRSGSNTFVKISGNPEEVIVGISRGALTFDTVLADGRGGYGASGNNLGEVFVTNSPELAAAPPPTIDTGPNCYFARAYKTSPSWGAGVHL